jgi:hypothetical protein
MLNLEFFGDGLPEKKLQLVGISILLILLSLGPGCYRFKRGIGNFATKRWWMHSTIIGGLVLLPPEDHYMIWWWTLRHKILTFGIKTKWNYALRKLRKAQLQYLDWKEVYLSSMVNNKAHKFTLKESQTAHLENIWKAQCQYSQIERNPTCVKRHAESYADTN